MLGSGAGESCCFIFWRMNGGNGTWAGLFWSQSRTWLPLCEVAPLNKETEESQKEQAVSQQIRENGATPTGGQARRRNGPASMAASYLNIAQLLGKARGWGLVEEESWLCFPKNLFAIGKKSHWLCYSKALGFSCWRCLPQCFQQILPAPCLQEVCSPWELPKILDWRPHPAVGNTSPLPPTSPQSLGSRRHGKRDLWACTADLARCCHHHGFLQAWAELFWSLEIVAFAYSGPTFLIQNKQKL